MTIKLKTSYSIIRTICGDCNHGRIYLGKLYSNKLYNLNVAIKINKYLEDEFKLIKELGKCDYIIKMYGYVKSSKVCNFRTIAIHQCRMDKKIKLSDIYNDRLLILKYYKYDAYEWRRTNYIEVETFKLVCNRLLLGLQHMHKKEILHCDIKLENLLCEKNIASSIVYCDFGNSITFDDIKGVDIYLTTIYNRPPERLVGGLMSEKCDIYSLGCTLFRLYTLLQLFTETDGFELNEDYCLKEREDYMTVVNENIFDKDLNSLLCGMLKYNPKNRFTLQECLDHEYLNDH